MLEFLQSLISFILHIDKHLVEIVSNYQIWTYLILCLIIFCETGLVVTPFLPGDSLLFAVGSVAALDGSPLDIVLLILLIFGAALLGDNVNYWIGRLLGQKIYDKNYRLVKREHIDKTRAFYDKHGGKAIIMARFLPIIRTFAPFVAGIGKMVYPRFLSFSLLANLFWVYLFCLVGYFFGNIPFIKEHFTIVILAIISISLVPPLIAFIRMKFKRNRSDEDKDEVV